MYLYLCVMCIWVTGFVSWLLPTAANFPISKLSSRRTPFAFVAIIAIVFTAVLLINHDEHFAFRLRVARTWHHYAIVLPHKDIFRWNWIQHLKCYRFAKLSIIAIVIDAEAELSAVLLVVCLNAHYFFPFQRGLTKMPLHRMCLMLCIFQHTLELTIQSSRFRYL